MREFSCSVYADRGRYHWHGERSSVALCRRVFFCVFFACSPFAELVWVSNLCCFYVLTPWAKTFIRQYLHHNSPTATIYKIIFCLIIFHYKHNLAYHKLYIIITKQIEKLFFVFLVKTISYFNIKILLQSRHNKM